MEVVTTRQWSKDTQTVEDENDIYALVRAIATSSTEDASRTRFESISTILLDIKRNEESRRLVLKGNQELDYQTPLHMACSMFYLEKLTEKKVVELLVEEFPDMILSNRQDSDMYRGQTPLHMAICRGNMWLVDTMLNALSATHLHDKKVTCLEQRATGLKFKNTVLLAEIPLSIAALTCNKELFEKLLEHGARVDGVNSQSDSIYHCFIVYAYLYPEKVSNILDMMKYIHEESKVDETSKKKLMLMDRMGRETTLQMAARYGQHMIFAYILEHAYCYLSNKDGLFDIKMYDVTDIDQTLARALRRENSALEEAIPGYSQSKESPTQNRTDLDTDGTILSLSSIFDTMFDLNYITAFEFLQQAPIRRLIHDKWKYYRLMFYPFWLFHTIFMILLTVSAVERARIVREREAMIIDESNTTTIKKIWGLNEKLDSQFVTTFAVISVIVACIYLAQEVMRIVNRRMPFNMSQFLNPYANGGFRSSLVLFALCLIGDFGATWSPSYEDYLLIVAIIVGWLWFLFFIRAIRRLSFFTSLIQRVLISDIARFAVIIIFELIAFNTAFFLLLQGPPTQEEPAFNSWWATMVKTALAFLGIYEIPVFKAKQPVVLSLVYLMTVVLTTILMLNALIAVMSNTCTELLSNFKDVKEMHLRLQQLSVILFFESLLPATFAEKIASKVAKREKIFCFDLRRDSECNLTRYVVQIDSIRDAENVSYQESREEGFGLFPNFDRIFGTRMESKPKFSSMLGNRDGINIFSKNFANSLGNAKGQITGFKNISGFAMSSSSLTGHSSESLESKRTSTSSFSSTSSNSVTLMQSTQVERQAIQMQKVSFDLSSGNITNA
ncbi:hypothetical protein CHS0354_020683 [Potamilus streckersoni]|uniref:Ion transport domain-containing protein n=1 Tax=Potamilus streckersoni TaxID=2493646 RepID=A0AAE0SEB9_9BIVA|nr:hypothetical protein CHS0354_020683 [Potamilus streckersoni]